MAVNVLSINEIVSDPAVRGGRPVIAGTGIRVVDIVAYHRYGDRLAPADLAAIFNLSMGQVHAALAYYYLHQTAIDQQMNQDDEEAEHVRQELKRQGRVSE